MCVCVSYTEIDHMEERGDVLIVSTSNSVLHKGNRDTIKNCKSSKVKAALAHGVSL